MGRDRLISHVFGVFVLCTAAWSQTSPLEVQPASIDVSPSYSGVEARVVLKATTPIRKASLSWMSNDGLNVNIDAAQSKGTSKDVVWKVRITNLDRARLPGSILFEVIYGGAASTIQHAFATLKIAQQDSQQKPIEASVEGSFDAISQQRPAFAYLMVTNNLAVPVDISVDPFYPRDVFDLPTPAPVNLPARAAAKVPICLKTWGRITPGTYPILFVVTAQWQWAGSQEKRQVLISKSATAGVFFESELLKLLGVPSFLVLPGCLALFTMQLLLTMGIGGLKNDSKLWFSQLTVSSPGFWIIAITFSAIFAWVYTFIPPHNNYLLRYGLNDLRTVWVWSIALGALFYFLYSWRRQKWLRERVPTQEDKPIPLLRKMGGNNVSVLAPRVKYKLGTELLGYVVEQLEDEMQKVWVVPLILIVWSQDEKLAEQLIGAKKRLEKLQNKRPPAAADEFAREFDEAEKQKLAGINWSTDPTSVPHPYHLKLEAVTGYVEREWIFKSV